MFGAIELAIAMRHARPHILVMLTEKQTRWVEAFVSNGLNATAACRTAGYVEHFKSGWRLKRNPKILAAVQDALGAEALTRLLPTLHHSIIAIARDPSHKDCLKACTWLLGIAGFSPKLPRQERKVEVEFTGNAIEELRRLQHQLGRG